MNVELLERVKQHILEEPRRFKMASFIETKRTSDDKFYDYDAPLCGMTEFAQCGTAACIGGWALLLDGAMTAADMIIHNGIALELPAAEALGIDYSESERLFYIVDWPISFRLQYEAAKTPAEKAAVAANRINHFIATNGTE